MNKWVVINKQTGTNEGLMMEGTETEQESSTQAKLFY